MATKGIKRIRINNIGREGIDNIKGLRQIEEININHPKGINPEFEESLDTTKVLGGNSTYPIKSTKQLNNEFLLGTSNVDVNLLQNIYLDTYVSASVQNIGNSIRTFAITSPLSFGGVEGYENIQDLQYAFQGPGSSLQSFDRDIDGNVEGWWASNLFKIKQLPNTVFKISGEFEFEGTQKEVEIYATIADRGLWGGTTFNYKNPTIFPDKRALGYLPLQKFTVTNTGGNPEVVPFEFMVTQSYSRILNAPLGPSYTKTVYFEDGNSEVVSSDYQEWGLLMGTKEHLINGFSSKTLGNNSFIKIEPITIVNADLPYGQPKPSGGGLQDLIGDLVQPPSSKFTEFDSTITPSELDVNRIYSGGEAFYYDDYRYINLWDNQEFGSTTPPSNITEQVITGRLSTYAATGSTNAWSQLDINGNPLVGWRYNSLRSTSSLVPINNSNDNYSISDFNPLIDNAINIRPSNIYYDLNYNRGINEPLNKSQIINQTAIKATVVDSNYSSKGWSNLRYNGSRVSSNNINQK